MYMCMCVYIYIYIYIYILFQILFPYRLLQNIEYGGTVTSNVPSHPLGEGDLAAFRAPCPILFPASLQRCLITFLSGKPLKCSF